MMNLGYRSMNRKRMFDAEGSPYVSGRFFEGKNLIWVLPHPDSDEAWMSPAYSIDPNKSNEENAFENFKLAYIDEVACFGTWLRRFMQRSKMFERRD
ncbi:hypothetical protein J4474_05200 [Candidatus Pacearchaeota archaeon]|nr:hypothetical protein [Candidatus Pacearchaeota archaeon]